MPASSTNSPSFFNIKCAFCAACSPGADASPPRRNWHCAAGHHQDLRAAGLSGGQHALIQHLMAPGEVGADQHNEVRLVQILVGAVHRFRAKGALVPRRA